MVQENGVLQAAAAAAERRARDDAGCACGAKGGTSFTEAEVTILESQPISAAAEDSRSTRDPSVEQPGDAKQNTANAIRLQGQGGKSMDVSAHQQSELCSRHAPQQRGDTGKQERTREEVDMQELIDLTADSDAEPELLD